MQLQFCGIFLHGREVLLVCIKQQKLLIYSTFTFEPISTGLIFTLLFILNGLKICSKSQPGGPHQIISKAVDSEHS